MPAHFDRFDLFRRVRVRVRAQAEGRRPMSASSGSDAGADADVERRGRDPSENLIDSDHLCAN
jgi:hypothetical protein